MSLQDKVYEYLLRNDIDLKGKTVVIGVSCGLDSMCLLDICEKMEAEFGLKIVVAHVNHKRRAESEVEEAYIKEYCKGKHSIYVLEFEECDEHIPSFQEFARIKRLDFFKNVMIKEDASYLLLAHHLNDDMETSFMHLLRKGSLNSISGINEVSKYKDITILRPFLRVLKSELYQYAKDFDIKFFEDSSNATDDYKRNRVRHNIIPELFKENPSFDEAFLEYKEKLTYASKLIDEKRDEFINNKMLINENISFNLDDFNNIDDFLKKEVLFEVLKKHNFGIENIEEVIKILDSLKKSYVNNYKDICIIKDNNSIVILNNNYISEDINIVIDGIGEYTVNDNFILKVSELKEDEKKLRNCISNISEIWYNRSQLPFMIRKRINGDKIKLSSGHKKVKDLLIDAHLSCLEKDNVLLLLDKDDNILSVLGIKKSQILADSVNNDIKIEFIRRK